jgi:hypothetical protein
LFAPVFIGVFFMGTGVLEGLSMAAIQEKMEQVQRELCACTCHAHVFQTLTRSFLSIHQGVSDSPDVQLQNLACCATGQLLLYPSQLQIAGGQLGGDRVECLPQHGESAGKNDWGSANVVLLRYDL